MANRDLYSLLGVSKNASEGEIKSAYRTMAKKYHPDMFANAPVNEKTEAEAKFKEVNTAYEILSDSQKRATYDRYGESATKGDFSGFNGGDFGGGMGGFEDILNNIFSSFGGMGASAGGNVNGKLEGEDINVRLTIDLKEAAFGVEKEINVKRSEKCADCKGSGANNESGVKVCPKCKGSGQIKTVQNSIFGQVYKTGACDQCGGKGKIITDPCKACNGSGEVYKSRIVKVSIPAGVESGQTMTYYNEGNAGKNGGANGNLVIYLEVATHPIFKRKGSDLFVQVPITFSQASLGCKVEAPTLSDKVTYVVPEATQSGTVFRLKGKGIKNLRKESSGDLFVTVVVETPKSLTKEQRALFEKLESTTTIVQYPKSKS